MSKEVRCTWSDEKVGLILYFTLLTTTPLKRMAVRLSGVASEGGVQGEEHEAAAEDGAGQARRSQGRRDSHDAIR